LEYEKEFVTYRTELPVAVFLKISIKKCKICNIYASAPGKMTHVHSTTAELLLNLLIRGTENRAV